MKHRNCDLLWIPLWVDKWLFGSTRIELLPDERSVWVDLLALAAKDDGYIRANEEVPYREEQLAGFLNVSLELLNRTVLKCLESTINKLERTPQNTLRVINWASYSLSKRHKRRFMSHKKDTVSKKADIRVEYSRVEKSKVKKSIFTKPTIEEITSYCKERENTVDPQKWFDWYQANGWRVGKNPMKDWKAAVRTWEKKKGGWD